MVSLRQNLKSSLDIMNMIKQSWKAKDPNSLAQISEEESGEQMIMQ